MPRRSRKNPFPGLDLDNVQLQGIVAKFDTICHKCHEDIIRDRHRIVRVPNRPDRWMHVTCANGMDEA